MSLTFDTYENATHLDRVAMRDAVETMMSEYVMSIRDVLLAIADECDACETTDEHMQTRSKNAAIALRQFANDPRIRE